MFAGRKNAQGANTAKQDFYKVLLSALCDLCAHRGRRTCGRWNHMCENHTNQLVGHNYTTPDLLAKVTGRAKYAEDYRVDGMLFAKLLLSPMPHARVVRIDTRAAMALPGVKAILTVDDLPPVV